MDGKEKKAGTSTELKTLLNLLEGLSKRVDDIGGAVSDLNDRVEALKDFLVEDAERRENAPRWMSLDRAIRYCPFGKKKLIQLIKEDVIEGGQLELNKNAWFLDRCSLDQYMSTQILGTTKKMLKEQIEKRLPKLLNPDGTWRTRSYRKKK